MAPLSVSVAVFDRWAFPRPPRLLPRNVKQTTFVGYVRWCCIKSGFLTTLLALLVFVYVFGPRQQNSSGNVRRRSLTIHPSKPYKSNPYPRSLAREGKQAANKRPSAHPSHNRKDGSIPNIQNVIDSKSNSSETESKTFGQVKPTTGETSNKGGDHGTLYAARNPPNPSHSMNAKIVASLNKRDKLNIKNKDSLIMKKASSFIDNKNEPKSIGNNETLSKASTELNKESGTDTSFILQTNKPMRADNNLENNISRIKLKDTLLMTHSDKKDALIYQPRKIVEKESFETLNSNKHEINDDIFERISVKENGLITKSQNNKDIKSRLVKSYENEVSNDVFETGRLERNGVTESLTKDLKTHLVRSNENEVNNDIFERLSVEENDLTGSQSKDIGTRLFKTTTSQPDSNLKNLKKDAMVYQPRKIIVKEPFETVRSNENEVNNDIFERLSVEENGQTNFQTKDIKTGLVKTTTSQPDSNVKGFLKDFESNPSKLAAKIESPISHSKTIDVVSHSFISNKDQIV